MAKSAAAKEDELDPIIRHAQAYDELWDAQKLVQDKARALELARRDVIEFVENKLKRVPSIKERLPKRDGTPQGPALTLGNPSDPDPIREFLMATESARFQALGGNQKLPPLAIYHVNDMRGGPITCPECGHEINHENVQIPDDARGRDSDGMLPPPAPM